MKKMCEIKLPPSVKFNDDHQWVSKSGPYRIGLSDYAQDQLGDLIFVDLPEIGTLLSKGREYGTVESNKQSYPLLSPVDGKVVAVNDELSNDPTLVNSAPYDQGWIIEIELDDSDQLNCLVNAEDYQKKLEGCACGCG